MHKIRQVVAATAPSPRGAGEPNLDLRQNGS